MEPGSSAAQSYFSTEQLGSPQERGTTNFGLQCADEGSAQSESANTEKLQGFVVKIYKYHNSHPGEMC